MDPNETSQKSPKNMKGEFGDEPEKGQEGPWGGVGVKGSILYLQQL